MTSRFRVIEGAPDLEKENRPCKLLSAMSSFSDEGQVPEFGVGEVTQGHRSYHRGRTRTVQVIEIKPLDIND